MKKIIYQGPDELSPPVRLPGSDGVLQLKRDEPAQVCDSWAECLLAGGPEFVEETATTKPNKRTSP